MRHLFMLGSQSINLRFPYPLGVSGLTGVQRAAIKKPTNPDMQINPSRP